MCPSPSVQPTKTFQTYDHRTTSLAGTKFPVTPISRSARSFRADRRLAARLMSGGQPTTAPITRSTIHLPLNSFRRARSYARSAVLAVVARDERFDESVGKQLAAAQRRVDAFAGERVEEIGRVADQRSTRRPDTAAVRAERSRRDYGRHALGAAKIAPRDEGATASTLREMPCDPARCLSRALPEPPARRSSLRVRRRRCRRTRRARRASRPARPRRRTPV